MRMANTSIEAAHQRLTDRVIDLEGVSGTAIGLDGDSPCLKVMVSTNAVATQIPKSMDGFRVVVETTGAFTRW